RLVLFGDFEDLAGEDRAKGRAMAFGGHPRNVLMDVEIPVVDGWEATGRLRVGKQTPARPRLPLAPPALPAAWGQALAAGCDEFDTKPIEFDRLVATLRRVLAARKGGTP